jgi:hypothetical protein
MIIKYLTQHSKTPSEFQEKQYLLLIQSFDRNSCFFDNVVDADKLELFFTQNPVVAQKILAMVVVPAGY